MVRRLLQTQSDTIDATLLNQHRQAFPSAVVHADGHEPITVASRFTQRVPALELSRQVCQHPQTQTHVMPGNAVLPPHNGSIITRGLPLLGLSAPSGVAVCAGGAPARLANR